MSLQLLCALLLLDGDAPARSGGVFALSADPRQSMAALKAEVKRRKPNDLRGVAVEALRLFLAAQGDDDRWLSDEHEVALALEQRGAAVPDEVLGMLGRGSLDDGDTLGVYLQESGLPPPQAEQLHLLVVVETSEMPAARKRRLETTGRGRQSKPKHGEEQEEQEQRAPEIELSYEQSEFVRLAVEQRRNMLLVAPAGYGKSAVIHAVIRQLEKKLPIVFDQPVCGLCAPTGKAASLIRGRTLHSFLGIGMGRGTVNDWVERVRPAVYMALRGVQVMIIDEISMVSAQFLDRISDYLQRIRQCPEPFGGVQMILVGDLCQLPPVVGAYIFRSHELVRGQFLTFRFTKCFRQNDRAFIDMLSEIRFAKCSESTMATLRQCTGIEPEYANGMTPMHIVSTNKEVDAINERALRNITADGSTNIIRYDICVSPLANPKKAEAYQIAEGIPNFVRLAVGCQIVVTQNIGGGLVNGTQGRVIYANQREIKIELLDKTEGIIEFFPYKDPEEPDVFKAETLFTYMPVRLGYASTVHKAQGMTLQLLEVDLKRVFAHGQLYTAISRVTDLRGLVVKNLNEQAFICSDAVREFYAKLLACNTRQPPGSQPYDCIDLTVDDDDDDNDDDN